MAHTKQRRTYLPYTFPAVAGTHLPTLRGWKVEASGVFRGGGLCLGPPFLPTIIFYDGILGCFTDFFLRKHQNLGIQ